MHIDPYLALAGLAIGTIVGMTGMGGGALMTPVLVLVFGVQPLAAISSDLVAAVVMKPVGSLVHRRERTIHGGVVRWLAAGSIPGAFTGVGLVRLLGDGESVQDTLKVAMGAALVLAVVGLGVRILVERRRGVVAERPVSEVPVRRVATLAVGLVGGVIVGMTSVGSGSLIIVMLALLYPTLSMRQLVGTDLTQAVPLVAAAALGQWFLGDVQLPITAALLIGSIPGVIIGARISSKAPTGLLRWALATVLATSGVKLLGASTTTLAYAALAGAALGLALLAYRALPGTRRRTTVPAGAK